MELLWVLGGGREGTEREESHREKEIKGSGWWELKEMGWISWPLWTQERWNCMRWSDAQGDQKNESERKGNRRMAGCCRKQSLQSSCLSVYSSVTYYRLRSELWCGIELKLKTCLAERVELNGWIELRRERRRWNGRVKKLGQTKRNIKDKWVGTHFTLHSLIFLKVKHMLVCTLFLFKNIFGRATSTTEILMEARKRKTSVLFALLSVMVESFGVFEGWAAALSWKMTSHLMWARARALCPCVGVCVHEWILRC